MENQSGHEQPNSGESHHIPVDPSLMEEDANSAVHLIEMSQLAQVAAGTPYAQEPAAAGPSYSTPSESTPNIKSSASGAAMLKQYGLEHCENSVDKAYHRYGGDRCAACQQANKSRCVPRKPGDPPTTCWLCAKNHVYCSFRGDPPRRRATLPKGGIEPALSPAPPPSAPRPARAAAAKRKRESDADLSGSEGDSDRSRPFNVPSGSSTQPRPALIITPENKAAVAKAWGALTLSVEGQQRRLKNNIPIGPGEVGDLVQAWSQMGKFLGYLSQQQYDDGAVEE